MKSKKLLAIFLALVMVIGFVPGRMPIAQASSDDGPYTDLEGYTNFTYKGEESTGKITLAGSMNGWNNNDENLLFTREDNNVFRLKVKLEPGDYEYKFIVDGKWTPDHAENFKYTVPKVLPETDSNGVTTFYYNGNDSTNKVSLAGSMNGWNINDENLLFTRGDNNVFTLDVELEPGEYKYKYIVDGDWTPDNHPDLVYTVPGDNQEPSPEPQPEPQPKEVPVQEPGTTRLIVHFDNPRNEDWSLWVWADGHDGKRHQFDYEDEYGQFAVIDFQGPVKRPGFIVSTEDWKKDVEQDRFVDIIGDKAEIWLKSQDSTIYYENPDAEAKVYEKVDLKVHYSRYSKEEMDGWKALVWADNQDEIQAKEVSLNKENDRLVQASLSLDGQIERLNVKFVQEENGNIIREDGPFEVRSFDDNGQAEVWFSQGDPFNYPSESTATREVEINKGVLDGVRKVSLDFNRLVDSRTFNNGLVLYDGTNTINSISHEETDPASDKVTFLFDQDLEMDTPYEAIFYLDEDKTMELKTRIEIGDIVSDPSFDEKFVYDGQLGPIYSANKTEFKVWAPTAKEVNLLIYEDQDYDKGPQARHPMVRGDRGVYSYTLEGNQDGTIYMYEVHVNGRVNQAVDPYAKSVTINGQRSVVVDPKPTNVARPDKQYVENPIIWELHVRDLSNHPDSGIDNKGLFLGLTEEGTKTSTGQITGLDYIKSLGVSHVQLLPIYDFGMASVDERNPQEKFNWGYDPVNYNSVEGSYSTDPSDPYVRIKELQKAIDTLHENNLGVIMDVVYNHVFEVGSHAFDKIVPGYYFRYDDNGNLHNGTGVGNETASERKMMRNYMVDSLKYWAQTFKLDGFRFDLMGIHDVETMQEIYDELVKINPNIFILGEGWSMGSHTRGARPSDQVHANQIPGIGMFNDHLRDLAKGSVFNASEGGFVNGSIDEKQLLASIKTSPNVAGKNYDNPRQFIQYVEAHDNLTLWDKLLATNPGESEEVLLKRHKLATSIPLLSQGVPFIHAGQEFARTKDGDENSYKSSAKINQLDWVRAEKFADNVEYFRQLVEIRKNENLFWMDSFEEINKKFIELEATDGLIAFRLFDKEAGKNYYIAFNASNQDKEIQVENGTYTVLVKDQKAKASGLEELEISTEKISIAPLSTLVIKQDEDQAKELDEVVKTYTYKINYKRMDGDYDGWNMWIWNSGFADAGYDFTGRDGDYAKVTLEFPSNSIGLKLRKGDGANDWAHADGGDKTVTVPQGKSEVEVWFNQADDTVYYENPQGFKETKQIEFNYNRQDDNYNGWNLWIWSSNFKDGQHDFDSNGQVIVPIGSTADNVGFKIRKGQGWDNVDVDQDRYVEVDPNSLERITRVYVDQGEFNIRQVPYLYGPQIKSGDIHFYFRDLDLYETNDQEKLDKVQVKIKSKDLETGEEAELGIFDMTYDQVNQYYSYILKDAEVNKVYTYTFLVEEDGKVREIHDIYNHENELSTIEYRESSLRVRGKSRVEAVEAGDSFVVDIEIDNPENVGIKEVYIDATNVGNLSKIQVSPGIMAQAIEVGYYLDPGPKQVTVVAVDQYDHRTQSLVDINTLANTDTEETIDWDEEIIYFLLTDRFKDGDPSNNHPGTGDHLEAYHGGDFQGIIDKVDYLKDLGVTTIWITPIVDNIDDNMLASQGGSQYAYHGYWARNFEKLEESLGDMDKFKEMIDVLNDNGIKLMVDVVLNHSGYGTEDIFGDMIRSQDGGNDMTNSLAGLPDFRTEDPEVSAKLIEWQSAWLDKVRTAKGNTIDYFRIDTVKHVEHETWKEFKNALVSIDPDFKMIGEQYGASIDSTGGYLGNGMMDSLLDFEFKNLAHSFAQGNISKVEARLRQRNQTINPNRTMGQFLSSHDEDGFLLARLNGDENLMKVVASLQLTAKGQPVIYYGEEIGMSGLNADFSVGRFGENRKDFDWNEAEKGNHLLDHYKKVINIRKDNASLFARGDRETLYTDNSVSVFTRTYNGKTILVGLNISPDPKTVEIQVGQDVIAYDDLYSDYNLSPEEGVLRLTIPGNVDGGTVIMEENLVEADEQDPASPAVPGTSPEEPGTSPADPETGPEKEELVVLSIRGLKDGDQVIFDKANPQDIVIEINGELADFLGVKLNGKEMPKEGYSLVSGSTIITLKSDYLASLDSGDYTIRVSFADSDKIKGGHVDISFALRDTRTTSPVQTQDPSDTGSLNGKGQDTESPSVTVSPGDKLGNEGQETEGPSLTASKEDKKTDKTQVSQEKSKSKSPKTSDVNIILPLVLVGLGAGGYVVVKKKKEEKQ